MSFLHSVASFGAGEKPIYPGVAYYNRLDNTNTSGYIYLNSIRSVAISEEGYTAHCYSGRNSGYSRYYPVVQVFDPDGDLTFWKYADFNTPYDTTQPFDVCIDSDYVYYAYGHYNYPITSVRDRLYMTCFDKNTGAVQWNRMYDDIRINTNNAVGHRLANGASGELVMAGKYANTMSNGGYIARISKTDGSIVASKRTTDNYTTPNECHGIKYINGTIFYNIGYADWSVNYALTTVNQCGSNGTDKAGFDAGPNLVAHLATNKLIVSNHSFVQQWGISMSGISNPRDVMIDSDDNVYLCYDNGSKITKFDSTGSTVWQRSLASSGLGIPQRSRACSTKNGFFVTPRINMDSLKTGIHKLNVDGTGTGTIGDITYSSTTQSFSTDSTSLTSESGTIANDIGDSSSQSVTWYNQGGTNTETVYSIT